ncbi:hypothetical protein FKM82_014569 [Ascaphus truei]
MWSQNFSHLLLEKHDSSIVDEIVGFIPPTKSVMPLYDLITDFQISTMFLQGMSYWHYLFLTKTGNYWSVTLSLCIEFTKMIIGSSNSVFN